MIENGRLVSAVIFFVIDKFNIYIIYYVMSRKVYPFICTYPSSFLLSHPASKQGLRVLILSVSFANSVFSSGNLALQIWYDCLYKEV